VNRGARYLLGVGRQSVLAGDAIWLLVNSLRERVEHLLYELLENPLHVSIG
jgi:hypothetical protein